MGWVLYIYVVLVVVTGIGALAKGAIYPGIAGIVGPMLCWWAGSGLKGSLLVGTHSQRIGGLAAAIVFVVVGCGIVYHSGYWVSLFGYELLGTTWSLIGLALGYMATRRKHAVG